ncbi:MAG: MarR family winged helix-turn-helix transcriptional regulator [Actinomycetota bacterium]
MDSQLAKSHLKSQQYQLLLAIKGFPKGGQPTMNSLAERLQLHQNSVSQLVDRCRNKGLVRRSQAGPDRRKVILSLTAKGEASLQKLAAAARQELSEIGPRLVKAIKRHSNSRTTRNKRRRSR